MRVLHFCRSFSPLSETFVYDYVLGLERHGVENHVVAYRRQNAASRPFARVVTIDGALRWAPRRLAARMLATVGLPAPEQITWPAIRRHLRRAARRIAPGIVHAHFGPEGAMIAPVAAALRLPLVVTFYGFDISQLARLPSWQDAYARLWPAVSAVTVLSADMERQALRLGCPPEKLHVIHIGRDGNAVPARTGVRHPVRRLVSVGRLVEKKGHLDAVEVVGRLAADHPGLQLEIVGEGELRPRLERRIQELGLADRIRLRGALPNDRTLEIMARADGFLLCCRTGSDGDQEGTPTVLLEAQMIGLPCVATTHAGIPELFAPENHALLAPEGDVEALARRVSDLLARDEGQLQRIVDAGRRHVLAHFDVAAETRKLVDLYTACAHAARGKLHDHRIPVFAATAP